MKKRKNIITVAIDSPAAAGAGTQAKLISKHYNLFYLDTGKIYRYIGNLKLKLGTKFSYNLVKRRINTLNLRKLKNRSLLSNEVAISASKIAKEKKNKKYSTQISTKMRIQPSKKIQRICVRW